MKPKIAILFIMLTINCVGCGKVGDALGKIGKFADHGRSSQMPIAIGDDFKILLNNQVVNVIGFDKCRPGETELCILVKPETKTVKVRLLLKPVVIEVWEVQHVNNNEKISFRRPNGDLVIFSKK